ncbi:MAG: Hsp20/alpha crystallin family protein [Candidatus Omnitrophica bacterium]|nr:Hsp20/alpha crystallin family protein [Candidatus Omnitrophota bacterium]
MRTILVSIFTVGIILLTHASSIANETQDLKNQVKTLQQKVDELEKQNVYNQWDPWAQMRMMENQMGQLMKENVINFYPREDMKQTPNEYIVSMDIPGMQKDDINVEVKGGMLIVSGDRSSKVKEQKPNQFFRQERSFGYFLRTIALPDDARTDHIDARYDNGVLTVKIPRAKAGNTAVGEQKIKIK